MTQPPFSLAAVQRALGGAALASVEVVERLPASTAEVARLRIAPAGGGAPFTAIAKRAAGAGLDDARRELRFFEHVAPRWPSSPTPRLLGACEEGSGADARLLLLTEDLGAAGYALAASVSEAQLHAAADALVALHARFWEDLLVDILDPARPAPSVTRAAQAWPPAVIRAHAADARAEAARFLAGGSPELAPWERALLEEALARWAPQLLARAADGRAITLIHGDFHLLGNVFFAAHDPRPRVRVIDWSELKPGLGPHDLAYCSHAAPAADRPTRDLALLRRYWEGLRAAGVEAYSWELCQWDYQLSLVTNLFQSIFQRSLHWFRRTAALIVELDGRSALRAPPPVRA